MQKFMRAFFLVFFLLGTVQAFSQDSITCYYDKNWSETTVKDSAAYFRVGERTRSQRWEGGVKDYYISGKVQMKAHFVNGKQEGVTNYYHENGQLSSSGNYNMSKKTGAWKSYHKNGQLEEEGEYEGGEQTGTWKGYHDNGEKESEGKYEKGYRTGRWKYAYSNKQPESEGVYDEGDPTGVWKYYYMNGVLRAEIKHIVDKKGPDLEQMITFSDSLGHVTLKNGTGKYSWYNKKTEYTETGEYLDGEKDGSWKGGTKKTLYEEEYEKGKLKKGKFTDENGETYTYTELQTPAEYKGGMSALMTYLSENIKYPEDARFKEIQGKVYIEFVVDNEGKVTKAKIKRGIFPSLDQEAYRVVQAMPDWTPARNRGKTVRQRYVLPVNFKITNLKTK